MDDNAPPTAQAPPTAHYDKRYGKHRRLAAICGAAIAAALFTPVPATAETNPRPAPATVAVSTVHPAMPTSPRLAGLLISTGMIGVGLAMGGLVIVTHRRRQW
jgi:hypothetical protein